MKYHTLFDKESQKNGKKSRQTDTCRRDIEFTDHIYSSPATKLTLTTHYSSSHWSSNKSVYSSFSQGPAQRKINESTVGSVRTQISLDWTMHVQGRLVYFTNTQAWGLLRGLLPITQLVQDLQLILFSRIRSDRNTLAGWIWPVGRLIPKAAIKLYQ